MNSSDILRLQPNPAAPCLQDEIEVFENMLRATLPDGHRQLLLKFGGCSFKSGVYYNDPQCACPVMFGWFFNIDELRDAFNSLTDNIPDTMIPIGEDSGGNTYCLGIRADDRNKVFFHDHNIGWSEKTLYLIQRGQPLISSQRLETVYLVNDSYEGFIRSMFIKE